MKRKLRIISLIMFVIAVIFVAAALSNPALGHVIYIGDFVFGARLWRICYAVYAAVMIYLFIASFIVQNKK
ncbi:MAG: hypothetical protein IIY47_04460 [Solobacterium sp.]|nr:hypothetical protein [Solobacterium sp.]